MAAPVVVSPPRRIARATSLGYHDGLVQRPLERLVGSARRPGRRLSLPHLLGLDADIVDLLLGLRLFTGRTAAAGRPGTARLTSDKQGPGVVMRKPSSPYRRPG